MRRRIPPTTDARIRVADGIQDPFNAAGIRGTILGEATGAPGLRRLVMTRASLAGRGPGELVGAGVAAAGELADGGDDQGPDTRNRRGDDDDCVLDVAPADELDGSAGAQIGDAGDLVEFGGFDDGGDHGTVRVRIMMIKGGGMQHTECPD